MAFCLGFPAYGCILNLAPFSRELTLYLFSIISLVPAMFSPLYCHTCSSFTLMEYIFLSALLPYTTIFYCVVRSLSKRRPFLKIMVLVVMYILIHVPLTFAVLNTLGMVTPNLETVSIINYICLGIIALVSLIGLVAFVVWLVASVSGLEK